MDLQPYDGCMEYRKVCVYGAGAIGGLVGVKLAAAGCELSVVARGATLEALRRDGLRLESSGTTSTQAVRAESDPAALGVQDLVIIAVKAPSLPDVARRLAPLLGPETVVLTAMNGVPWWFFEGFGGRLQGQRLQSVDPEGTIAQAIPARHVIGSVVHMSCTLDGPGYVRHHAGNKLILGEPSGAQSERVQQLAALLTRAGFEAPVSPQVQKDVWYKLWGNMTTNPISAITGATTDRIVDDELVRGFSAAMMLEAKAIGAKLGIPIAEQPEDRFAVTRKLGMFKTSMLQDVEANRPVELDALVASVRELGQLTQTPTPFLDVLFGLARLHARVHGLY